MLKNKSEKMVTNSSLFLRDSSAVCIISLHKETNVALI